MEIPKESLQLASSRILEYTMSRGIELPVVLLSTPLCMPLEVMDGVGEILERSNYRLLRYNLPGHGGVSTVPADLSETTFDSLAADVRALLTHLGIEKLSAWVGSGLGAATATVFAAKYPDIVERLVLADPIICSPVNAGIPDMFSTRVAAAREVGNLESDIEAELKRCFRLRWLNSNPGEAQHLRTLMGTTSLEGFETCCSALSDPNFDLQSLAAQAGRNIGSALIIRGLDNPTYYGRLRMGIESGQRIKTLRSGKG
ncbi:Alpha/Beta hydrolase protein [Xylaria acuta]|nr:Alpha/Beta hydrolase protein [Xylaria acuta]